MSKSARRGLLAANRSEERQIHSHPLTDIKIVAALSSFRRIVQSCYGPTGRLKFLQTVSGGHLTVTSTCSRILHHLVSVCHPILRLIIMAVRGHLDVYSDGGLSTSLLTIRLIESSLGLRIPRQVVIEVNSHAVDVLTSYLKSGGCPWKMKIDVGDVKSMICLLRSVVGTKPGCCLSDSNQEYICTILLKAFLQSLPTSKPNGHPLRWTPTPVQIISCEGSPVLDTRVIEGVILEAADLPTFLKEKECRTDESLKVALYNVSMAADTEEWFDSVTTVASGDIADEGFTGGVVQQMTSVAMTLVLAGVGLVACQKCIHPALRKLLKNKGVYVIDRLSVLHIGAVERLTGATVLSTFTLDIPDHFFGQLQSIEHTIIGNKSYLHLVPSSIMTTYQSVSTVILCSPNETTLEELKSVCQSAISVLHGTLASPFVVPGGGCLDTHLAWFLRCHAQQCSDECLEKLGCTKAQFYMVMNNVASCLEMLATSLEHDQGSHVTDAANRHHWSLPPATDPSHATTSHCMCHLVTKDKEELDWYELGIHSEVQLLSIDCMSNCKIMDTQERKFDNAIIDSFAARLNSLKMSFETANVILRVNCLVTDG